MDYKEDPMGKVKTIYCIAIDYDYIKFTFSSCGVEWVYDSEEALHQKSRGSKQRMWTNQWTIR